MTKINASANTSHLRRLEHIRFGGPTTGSLWASYSGSTQFRTAEQVRKRHMCCMITGKAVRMLSPVGRTNSNGVRN